VAPLRVKAWAKVLAQSRPYESLRYTIAARLAPSESKAHCAVTRAASSSLGATRKNHGLAPLNCGEDAVGEMATTPFAPECSASA
jgi:hypothetical protein